jgi:thymidine kinase
MFAGKSQHLMDKLEELEKSFICYKPAVDTRDGDFIVSRNGNRKLPAKKIAHMKAAINCEAEVIVLDEIQFFDNVDVAETLTTWRTRGKIVLLGGLDRLANGQYWKIYPLVESMADEIIHLKAVCDLCGGSATYTKKILGPNTTDREMQIEGEDGVHYIPVCAKCFGLH